MPLAAGKMPALLGDSEGEIFNEAHQ